MDSVMPWREFSFARRNGQRVEARVPSGEDVVITNRREEAPWLAMAADRSTP
jgi:hypothetical protein